MTVLDAIGRGLLEAFAMFWATLWALVLGFGLSGAVQAFVSRSQMQAALGDHRPKTVAKASFFGMVSSSCSYAASALAKSLFARGADFTAAMIFMVAGTNLVVELGIVLWLLIGWQFALAEFVGGAIMITLLALVLPRVVPAAWLGQARAELQADAGLQVDNAPTSTEAEPEPGADANSRADPDADPDADSDADSDADLGPDLGPDSETDTSPAGRIKTRAGWADAAGYTISDLSMLRRELVAGFLIAGFLAALVPAAAWNTLFITGHGFLSSLENVVLGPFLAVISFVCSVGNIPLAAALWEGGISFGGVVSFVFADLLTIPLLLIYRKYYGTRITLRLLAVFWAVMSISGLIVEYLFTAAHLIPTTHPTTVAATGIHLNYTTVLNVVALLAFGYLYWLHRNRDRFGDRSKYAHDVVCGMQVERANAPASARHEDSTYYFCSDRCQTRFLADPDRYANAATRANAPPPGE